MANSEIKIQVDIADQRFVGSDPFTNWQQLPRPAITDQPISFLGVAAENHVPFNKPFVEWDLIHLSADGFGVAVNHEQSQSEQIDDGGFLANVFITSNHAQDWQKNPMRLSWASRMRVLFSWPVEKFHSLLVTENRTVILAWEDPWIMERSRSHIIFSDSGGLKWHYRCLKQCNPCLSATPKGQVMCFSRNKRYCSLDEGKHWHSDSVILDLNNDDANVGYSDIQNATFVSEQYGFALLTKYDRTVTMTRPKNILLLKTDNNGLRWYSVAEFSFPRTHALGDPKSILSLRVL
jgi:hypothetical protein